MKIVLEILVNQNIGKLSLYILIVAYIVKKNIFQFRVEYDTL
jgi:hypothetical protein